MLRRYFYILLLIACSVAAQAQELKLFHPEMRNAVGCRQAVVMDFAERYFQQLLALKPAERQLQMQDDKVYFRKGKPEDLYQVRDTMAFSLNWLDRYYELSWMQGDTPFVTVVFPAQYELLLGKNQIEAQQGLRSTVLSAPARERSGGVADSLELVDDSIYRLKTKKYELEVLNDATYYHQVDGELQPVFSASQLEYSAANLFQGLIGDADYRMYVEQSVYPLTTINYMLNLQQWFDYCAWWGLDVYFGVEEQREDGLLVVVIAQSRELGFNHLLSVVIPDKFVADTNAVLKARVHAYIPIHSIKDLYQKDIPKRKRNRWK